MPRENPSVFGVLFASNASKIKEKYDARIVCKAAITFKDYQNHGCPSCLSNEKNGISLKERGGTILFECANCGIAYLIVKGKRISKPFRGNQIRLRTHPLPQ
jgi:predicted RNA-binding Zn-ribbon protein involved in translation (DUF1610 family)